MGLEVLLLNSFSYHQKSSALEMVTMNMATISVSFFSSKRS